MKELKGKRLLLLGGSLWKDAIRQFAETYGVVLLATGNNKSAGIFELARESFDVDSTNSKEMKRLISEQKIDGVYMGGSEPVIASACQYLNELELPCYCNPTQWHALQDKLQFKTLCHEYDLPVAKSFSVDFKMDNFGIAEEDLPVVVKPVDACGGAGFSVCKNHEELKLAYKNAKKASPTGSVIVEQYVKNTSVVVYYTFCNGQAFYSCMEDKWPVHFDGQGFIAGAHIFESPRSSDFRSKFERKLIRLFTELGIKAGSVWIEVFYSNGQYFFNEAGFRYSGSASMYPVDYLSGVNQVAVDCYYALTGQSVLNGFFSLIPQTSIRKKYYCIYLVPLNPGVITKIAGFEELARDTEFVKVIYAKKKGDIIKPSGNLSQNFAFLHFVFNTEEDFQEIIHRISKKTVVIDENGNNMIRPMLRMNDIDFALYS